MLYNLILNKIYPKFLPFIYNIGYLKIGKKSKIKFPRLKLSKKSLIIGDNVTICEYARLETYSNNVNKLPKIIIGDRTGAHYRFSIIAGDDVIIGDDVLIASDVSIISENHSINPEIDMTYAEQELSVAPVHISDGAWIGEKVCILPGVTIGKKSIIGAGSVVTKDIPEYTIAVGNPAKVIKTFNFKKKKWDKV